MCARQRWLNLNGKKTGWVEGATSNSYYPPSSRVDDLFAKFAQTTDCYRCESRWKVCFSSWLCKSFRSRRSRKLYMKGWGSFHDRSFSLEKLRGFELFNAVTRNFSRDFQWLKKCKKSRTLFSSSRTFFVHRITKPLEEPLWAWLNHLKSGTNKEQHQTTNREYFHRIGIGKSWNICGSEHRSQVSPSTVLEQLAC